MFKAKSLAKDPAAYVAVVAAAQMYDDGLVWPAVVVLCAMLLVHGAVRVAGVIASGRAAPWAVGQDVALDIAEAEGDLDD